jgi:AraC family transcriptional regulator
MIGAAARRRDVWNEDGWGGGMPPEEHVTSEIRLPNLSVEMRTVNWRTAASGVLRRSDYHVSRTFRSKNRPAIRCGYRPEPSRPLGQLSLVPANKPIPLDISEGEATFVSCNFEPRYFERFIGSGEWTDELAGRLVTTRNLYLEVLLDRIGGELMRHKAVSMPLLRALTMLIRVEAVEMVNRTRAGSNGGKVTNAQIEELCRSIDATPEGKNFDLSRLAARFSASPRHLNRRFRAVTGMTVHGYLQRARINRAKDLLGEDGLRLRDIAGLLGFADASHFAAEFRRQTGLSPSGYRADAKED